MKATLRRLALVLTALSVWGGAGCGSASTDVPLGKVVVYRNGVAYFEREARVEGRSLTLSVPQSKVDDFLKSLTVRDKASGKSLPVSFPSSRSAGGDATVVEMVIELPVADGTDVVLSYITESPAWKPSYRVVMSDDGKVQLEGWAIVDNTSGESWNDVVVGVGSSSALSFRYDLWSIRDVERQSLGGEQRFAVAPPTGASPHGGDVAAKPIEQLADEQLVSQGGEKIVISDSNQNIPIPGRTFESALESAAGSSDDGRGVSFAGSTSLESTYVVDGVNTTGSSWGGKGQRGASTGPSKKERKAMRVAKEKRARQVAELVAQRQKNDRRSAALAGRIIRENSPVVIEGFARLGSSEAMALSAARANLVRNNLIAKGVPPALVTAKGMGASEGVPPGVRVVAAARSAAGSTGDAHDEPVGESHFGSSVPMTVQKGTSAMVSIVKSETAGEVVYLYDSESERGNDTFAFKAVRLSNPTDNTLEAGPVTVYGKSRFIGEGLTEPIPPRSIALIPFALDRQIIVETKKSKRDKIASLVSLSRGMLTTEVDHTRETELSVTNRMNTPATVYVRHTVSPGWQLRSAPKNAERLGTAHLFAVRLAARETKTVTITEATPLQKLIDLRSEAALDMLAIYLESAPAKDVLAPLLESHRDMRNSIESIEAQREKLADYRVRMDELHGQIITLKAVKSGGSLLRHLKKKMREISDRVHQATLKLVAEQEELMLSRISFQDRLAELTLSRLSASPVATGPSESKPKRGN